MIGLVDRRFSHCTAVRITRGSSFCSLAIVQLGPVITKNRGAPNVLILKTFCMSIDEFSLTNLIIFASVWLFVKPLRTNACVFLPFDEYVW